LMSGGLRRSAGALEGSWKEVQKPYEDNESKHHDTFSLRCYVYTIVICRVLFEPIVFFTTMTCSQNFRTNRFSEFLTAPSPKENATAQKTLNN
jgi:hypothetical protein